MCVNADVEGMTETCTILLRGISAYYFMPLILILLPTFSVPRVCFLECDVGQTEFSPPGCVALTFVDKPVLGMWS